MKSSILLTVLSCLVVVVFSQSVTEREILAAGYQLIPGVGYYKVHAIPTTWEEAQNTCIKEGGYLLIYNSKEELEQVGKLMEATVGRENCFIGFHSLYKDNTAEFVQGVPLNSSAVTYYIDVNNNDRVGSSYPGGLAFWNPKDRTAPFVCERQLWSTYEVYSGHGRYKLHTQGKSWVEAYQTCKNEGAHLAVVNSDAEAQLLKGILQRFPAMPETENDNIALLGFHMLYDTRSIADKKKQYLTIFDSTIELAGYAKWASGQPKAGTENHCGAIDRTGKLYMAQCNMKLAYFCEKNV